MKKYLSLNYIKQNILIIIVAVIALILRFYNLGYSDFQGDEIKALYLPTPDSNFFNYIMDQRKGPIQFTITFLMKFLDPGYNSQLFLRFPFALAGFFAVIYFYKFVNIHFGKKVAFYSSFFFATNGFFVAFSRIIQYQSFVILFMVMSLYYLSLACKDERYSTKGIYIGLISWALSLLSHYDGIFIFPFVFYLLHFWFQNCDIQKKKKIKTVFLSAIISGALVLSFYIPFLFSISQDTKAYWIGRITGDVSEKISSTRYLFSVYQPIYAIHIYMILFVLGISLIILGLFSKKILKIKELPGYIRGFFTHSTEIMNNIQNENVKVISLLVWMGVGILFFEKFVYISGTHIYTYLVPVFIVIAVGFIALESAVFQIFEYQLVKIFNFLGLLILFSFLFAQSFAVFVDNRQEYPWEKEKFLIWTFPLPSVDYHLSLFGFPYYRNWEGIRNFVKSHPEIVAYSTNENSSISKYYIGLEKDTDKAGLYIFIKRPQSYLEEITKDKLTYWTGKYEPDFTLTKSGYDMVRLYIMEPGSAQEIIEKGF